MTIVVSEETGGVTITKNNELIRDLARQDYLKLLRNELVPKEEDKKQSFLKEWPKPSGKEGTSIEIP